MRSTHDDFKERKNKIAQAITPIFLYSIRYDETSNLWLRFTSYSSDVTFDGITYTKEAINHATITETLSGRIEKVRVNIQNIDRNMQYYIDNYDALKDQPALLTMVWKETLDNPLCFIEDEFVVESVSSNERETKLVFGSPLDVVSLFIPRCIFSMYRCRFEFKDSNCKYVGAESSCKKNLTACKAYSNEENFGAFPGATLKRMLIK